ncbi:DUF5718 family protein [Propionivibrio limicola]|uniref:DUF5718 family protein n=1 Tax=Propionivibrio limicola TaxID=167645 RepID=UPI001290A3ED|nr:DUF5718 family protein [Propionivibrio limicola]
MNLNETICFGVAGNFAGHLEQAGEASDFVNVKVKEAVAPKAIFPIYVPNLANSRLNVYPISSDTIHYPDSGDNLQIEPEVALLCDIVYDADKKVQALAPKMFTAFNDCSIRRQGARKISEKKNWGPASKGMGANFIPMQGFGPGDELDNYRIASFLRRDGECHAYGLDSPTVEYSYFHAKLLDWVIEKMNQQQDEGPAEDIAALLKAAGYPQQTIVTIGATRYTHFGETNFLQPGDESIVVVYDARRFSVQQIQDMAKAGEFAADGLSVVHQKVIPA